MNKVETGTIIGGGMVDLSVGCLLAGDQLAQTMLSSG